MTSYRHVLAAGVFACAATMAQAAVDEHSYFYSGGQLIDYKRISSSQTIDPFDTSLGTLTSVKFEVSGTELVDVNARSFGTLPYTINGGSSLYFLPGFVDFVQTGSGTADFTGGPIQLAATLSGSVTFTSNLLWFTSGGLNSYIESDPPQVRIDGTLVPASPGPPTVASTSITVKVSYFYDDGSTPAVPEPATWAMMIGGFALAGAGLRRQRPRVQARFA